MVKKNPDVVIIASWIDKNAVWCRSIVAGMEAEWKVAQVGVADPNGHVTTKEDLGRIHADLQTKLRKRHN